MHCNASSYPFAPRPYPILGYQFTALPDVILPIYNHFLPFAIRHLPFARRLQFDSAQLRSVQFSWVQFFLVLLVLFSYSFGVVLCWALLWCSVLLCFCVAWMRSETCSKQSVSETFSYIQKQKAPSLGPSKARAYTHTHTQLDKRK